MFEGEAREHRPAKVMAILGSGGHTAETLSLFKRLRSDLFFPLEVVIASSDTTSEAKALKALRRWCDKSSPSKEQGQSTEPAERGLTVHRIPRSREVAQSWLTTPFTALWSLMFAFVLVFRVQPRVIVTCGPGTAVPLCYAAFFFSAIGVSPRCRIVFVESFCRTRTLSLAGRLLLPVADRFFVQWPGLLERFPDNGMEFIGVTC